ncbi:Glutathione peroxidase 2 [Coemansia sp. RSA 2671]|uniref:Glutathione peroxidase n=1 Tax=Coemansia spiralis TaxID=417178 RepID=A0A9W8GL87_9FUNG|nr:Glutathione peroxidase 2 [Coemansia sp. RSA 2675]KAJ2349491.1 Glutathione peroxidase 2 [Coemansia sp. RSA 2671]KAJ2688644.1 Glutathione peroxidase 2 [Coemansia spiralis]
MSADTEQPAKPLEPTKPFYGFGFDLLDGKKYQFSQLTGKVVLIVNVASKCGFTPQYEGLQELYEKYGDKGLVILGFPSNEFAGQEPGTNTEIGESCKRNYGVTFPIMTKSEVNGKNENEVFKYLKTERPGLMGLKRIKWNFEKFLVDRNGNVVERWASISTPASMEETIKKYLAQK